MWFASHAEHVILEPSFWHNHLVWMRHSVVEKPAWKAGSRLPSFMKTELSMRPSTVDVDFGEAATAEAAEPDPFEEALGQYSSGHFSGFANSPTPLMGSVNKATILSVMRVLPNMVINPPQLRQAKRSRGRSFVGPLPDMGKSWFTEND
jgi:hypothetical protein